MRYMEENGMESRPKLTVSLCDKTLRSEISEDYTLPDYQPEIRRILQVIPTVLPPAKYVGNGNVEWNGSVDYQVFYVGSDGGIYTLSLSSDYGGQIPMEGSEQVDLNEGITVLVSTVSEGVNTRVSGPRRLNLRCRLCSKVRAYGEVPLEVREIGVRDPADLQRRTCEGSRMEVFCGVSDGILCHEEILGLGEDARVISAVADAVVENVRREADGLHVGGTVMLSLMLGRESGETETLLRKLPLDGVMEWEGSHEDCCVRAVVSEVQIHVEEGSLLCDVSVILDGRSLAQTPVVFVDDAYSLEQESECIYGEYRTPVALVCENGNFSQSERISMNEAGIPEGARVVQSFGSAWFEACKVSDGSYQLCGKSRYGLICEKDGEYSAAEVVLPLRYEIKGDGAMAEGFDATATVMSSRVRSEGDTLCVDTEWSVSADLVGSRTVTALREIRLGEPLSRSGSTMTVYYPAAEDTPWTVAKKYHVVPESIAERASYYFF